MKRLLSITILAASILAVIGMNLFAAAKAPTLDGSKWIWARGAGEAAGTWYFQKEFAFPAGQKPKKAQVVITCDNEWVLYVNGKKVGQDDGSIVYLTGNSVEPVASFNVALQDKVFELAELVTVEAVDLTVDVMAIDALVTTGSYVEAADATSVLLSALPDGAAQQSAMELLALL